MGQSSGMRRGVVCPVCGRTYTATNWMTRYGETADGEVVQTDAHRLKCLGLKDVSKRVWDRRFFERMSRRTNW